MPNGGLQMVNIDFLQVGKCRHPEFITIKGGKLGCKDFPAMVALIEHPKYGHILFDTGYSNEVFVATKKYPEKLYALITDISLDDEQELITQLSKKQIHEDMIKFVCISHLHADHIGNLKHFRKAQLLIHSKAHEEISRTGRFKALFKGILKELIPKDFNNRISYINKDLIHLPDSLYPFTTGYDIFGDRSILAIELPGHATGHYGLLINGYSEAPIFLIADACWSKEAFENYKMPHLLANLVFANAKLYQETLFKINKLYNNNKNIQIIPSHCKATLDSLLNGAS